MEYSHRERSNTAQRLEKMDLERKKAAKVNVKWENNPAISITQQSELFQRKDFRNKTSQTKRYSLLSEQLKKCPNIPQNPFIEYVKFDGSVRIDKFNVLTTEFLALFCSLVIYPCYRHK